MGHGKVLAQQVSLGLVPYCVSGSRTLGQGNQLPLGPTHHTSPELMGARVSTRDCSVLSGGLPPPPYTVPGLGSGHAVGRIQHSLALGRARITSGHSIQVAPPGTGPLAPAKGGSLEWRLALVPVYCQSPQPLCGSSCLYRLPLPPEPKLRGPGPVPAPSLAPEARPSPDTASEGTGHCSQQSTGTSTEPQACGSCDR